VVPPVPKRSALWLRLGFPQKNWADVSKASSGVIFAGDQEAGAERYSEVLGLAIETTDLQKEHESASVLRAFSGLAAGLRPASAPMAATLPTPSAGGEEWVVVIAQDNRPSTCQMMGPGL